MFVDACAIVSVMAGEETAPAYETALAQSDAPFTSAMAAWEAIIVLSRPDQLNCRYSEAQAVVTEWMDARGIDLREATDARTVLANAIAVAEKHGIGRRAPQQLRLFPLRPRHDRWRAAPHVGQAVAGDRCADAPLADKIRPTGHGAPVGEFFGRTSDSEPKSNGEDRPEADISRPSGQIGLVEDYGTHEGWVLQPKGNSKPLGGANAARCFRSEQRSERKP